MARKGAIGAPMRVMKLTRKQKRDAYLRWLDNRAKAEEVRVKNRATVGTKWWEKAKELGYVVDGEVVPLGGVSGDTP